MENLAPHSSTWKILVIFSLAIMAAPNLLLGQLTTPQSTRVSIKGFTEPYRSIDLAASEMGTLSKIEIREGDFVKANQILGRLNEDVLAATQAMIEQSIRATGKLDAAMAELKIRQETWTKVNGLFQRKHASQIELDRAQGQVEVAKARVEAVRDELRLKEYELKRVMAQIEQRRIRSTIDGVVTQVFKDEGEFVSSADAVVFQVVQLDPLLVVFSLPETLARRLAANMSVQIGMGSTKQPASGIVEFVSPVAEAQSGTFRVRVRIPNSSQKWQSGTPCHFVPELAFRQNRQHADSGKSKPNQVSFAPKSPAK
ncbi:MAG: efflux RND transporter periplasmic adaptor subunit [Planctomycetota bacterium]